MSGKLKWNFGAVLFTIRESDSRCFLFICDIYVAVIINLSYIHFVLLFETIVVILLSMFSVSYKGCRQ